MCRIGGFGGWVLAGLDKLDRALYGRRLRAVISLAALAVVAVVVDDQLWPHAPIHMPLTTSLFAALALRLGLARALSLRDEHGSWSLRLVFARVLEAVAIGADAPGKA